MKAIVIIVIAMLCFAVADMQQRIEVLEHGMDAALSRSFSE